MKKPSRYRVGSVFIYNAGHPMFEATLSKVGPDHWMKVNHKSKVRQYYSNKTVEDLFATKLLTLIHDSGKVER
jgi:hypothetical protein